MAVWLVMGLAGSPTRPPVPDGPFTGTLTLGTDVHEGRFGSWVVASSDIGPLLVELEVEASRGDRVTVTGTIVGQAGRAAGRAYGGILSVEKVFDVEPSPFLLHRAGRWIRERVVRGLEPFDDSRALVAGFLIGDTSRISEVDIDAMRRSGLAHFVAVSGSNVALFLALLAVVAGPLALGPRRRAAVGLMGLPVYAAATGFEPSVIRASLMAALALSGRLLGLVFEAWQLLAMAVAGLVLYDPSLTSNVGFQLSVAATAGVLVGARWPMRGLVRRALAVTMGAQLAVAPLIMFHFGSVPLLSPVVNLLAAPLVTVSTALGALGVGGFGFLVEPASWAAGAVLSLARGAARWPQLSVWPLIGVVGVGLICLVASRLRPLVVVLVSAIAVVTLVAPGQTLPSGSATVLDIGQGDAILIHGGGGRYVLVDGGPDPVAMIGKLRRYGVTAIELMVLTHVHADHAAGLVEVVKQIPVGEVWAVPGSQSTPASLEFFESTRAAAVAVVAPDPGLVRRVGNLTLRVEAPIRRYEGPNDQSIVITVLGPMRTMLLTGDIESHAQSDLAGLRADVLKVPHHGSDTSDPNWLSAVGAEVAVISVGDNDFGHPADEVIGLLQSSGARVLRTDEDGDVVVDLTKPTT